MRIVLLLLAIAPQGVVLGLGSDLVTKNVAGEFIGARWQLLCADCIARGRCCRRQRHCQKGQEGRKGKARRLREKRRALLRVLGWGNAMKTPSTSHRPKLLR